jgi:hypothetical protein
MLVPEARDLIERKEVDGCVCVASDVITAATAELIGKKPSAHARAVFIVRGINGFPLKENHRDMESVCALVCGRESASNSTRRRFSAAGSSETAHSANRAKQ